MIRYALTCADGHAFESWFQSAEAFDELSAAGHLSCAVCGAADVRKALMAPRLSERTDKHTDRAAALARMRKQVEENATYVGGSFATRVREMHEGKIPETAIYGEATAPDARRLIEDGIPVAPLPFKPRRKMQ